jgi:uncharacterized lipoprotein YajG
MSRTRAVSARVLVALLFAAAGGAVLGGCGTPAVVKAVATPLSGLQRDIHAARNAVALTEGAARADASASP